MKKRIILSLAATMFLACVLSPPTPGEEPLRATPVQRPRCGDDICDDKEKKSGHCPQDCGESTPESRATDAPGGIGDPDLIVDVYDPDRVWAGTTLLTDKHTGKARLIEVNMLGEIVWEYKLPAEWGEKIVGFEVEPLPNRNVLLAITNRGLYEVDRDGTIVWSHQDPKISHDADRLANGNTLYVFGSNDQKSDAQVKEVNPAGEQVWAWYAKDHFDYPPYSDISWQGWSHTNAVTRLENGNTLISIRNFDMIVEVGPDGEVVNTIEGIAKSPHDPLVLENGNILVVSQTTVAHTTMEIDPETKDILWSYDITERSNMPVRDCNRLPNGNTLITAARKIIEVTPEGEIVWQFGMADTVPELSDSAQLGFYKAERLSQP